MQNEKGYSGLKGSWIVSLEEGAILGSIQHIYIGIKSNKASAIAFRENLFGKTRYVPIDAVDRMGRDLIFIDSEKSVLEGSQSAEGLGRDLSNFKGAWITTNEGEHVGRFADLDFDRSDWTITRIYLSDGDEIPTDGTDVMFGKDEILIPTALLASKGKGSRAQQGFLTRIFKYRSGEQPEDHEGPHVEGIGASSERKSEMESRTT